MWSRALGVQGWKIPSETVASGNHHRHDAYGTRHRRDCPASDRLLCRPEYRTDGHKMCIASLCGGGATAGV